MLYMLYQYNFCVKRSNDKKRVRNLTVPAWLTPYTTAMTSRLFQRSHWPYPTTRQQVAHLVALLVMIILLGGTCAGALIWHTDHTPISAEEITLTGDDL